MKIRYTKAYHLIGGTLNIDSYSSLDLIILIEMARKLKNKERGWLNNNSESLTSKLTKPNSVISIDIN